MNAARTVLPLLLVLRLLPLAVLLASCAGSTPKPPLPDTAADQRWLECLRAAPVSGYPAANFGLMAEVPREGGVLGRLYANPPKLGPWLQDFGFACIEVSADGTRLLDREFASNRPIRRWPINTVALGDRRMPGLRVSATVYCPLSLADLHTNTRGYAVVELIVESDRPRDLAVALAYRPDVACRWRPTSEHSASEDAAAEHTASEGTALRIEGDRGPEDIRPQLVYDGALEAEAALGRVARLEARGRVEANAPIVLHFAVGHGPLPDPIPWASWRAQTAVVDSRMPATGHADLDDYVRWYATAGVGLTRLLPDGRVLTMGYAELNQRDSYWTSPIHLVLWPALERRMIEASAAAQSDAGKIPTTILPTIEREDDLDINAFFILRAARYVTWTRDTAFAATCWPHVARALDWLDRRDTNRDGIPEQVSFWGDWKDVRGIADRRDSPYVMFLFAAAVDAARALARIGRVEIDQPQRRWLDALDRRTAMAIERTAEDGGLWNGRYYANRFKDGRLDEHVQQDQLVGAVFDVIPRDRLPSIYTALEAGRQPWGLPETWPYRPASFGYDPGDYHNGAVWPYLSFVDARGRFRAGRATEALDLIRAVAHHDLVAGGDYLPHECLQSKTGINIRKPIQGWNATLFGTILFGYWGVARIAGDVLRIASPVPITHPVTLPLTVPEGTIDVSVHKRGITITADLTRELGLAIGERPPLRLPAGHSTRTLDHP